MDIELERHLVDATFASPYASECPACFGPSGVRSAKSRPHEQDVIVAFDACFQQRRMASASKEHTTEPAPPLFAPQSILHPWLIRVQDTSDLVNAKEARPDPSFNAIADF
jgi:hypothetical protein